MTYNLEEQIKKEVGVDLAMLLVKLDLMVHLFGEIEHYINQVKLKLQNMVMDYVQVISLTLDNFAVL